MGPIYRTITGDMRRELWRSRNAALTAAKHIDDPVACNELLAVAALWSDVIKLIDDDGEAHRVKLSPDKPQAMAIGA
jgi:hypothetical protein